MYIPPLNLTGRVPETNFKVVLEEASISAISTAWPLFHNGVAAGLSIVGAGTTKLSTTWIAHHRFGHMIFYYLCYVRLIAVLFNFLLTIRAENILYRGHIGTSILSFLFCLLRGPSLPSILEASCPHRPLTTQPAQQPADRGARRLPDGFGAAGAPHRPVLYEHLRVSLQGAPTLCL